MKTSGHLQNNGGIRGHSAGSFYPFRVMAQGKIHALTWCVINPQGDEIARYPSAAQAHKRAQEEYNQFTS